MNIETYKTIAKAYHLAKQEIVEQHSWQELVGLGLKVEAIMKYRNDHDCTLSVAKQAIDGYLETF